MARARIFGELGTHQAVQSVEGTAQIGRPGGQEDARGRMNLGRPGRPGDRLGHNLAQFLSRPDRFVTPGFFAAAGIPIRQGRDVGEADTRSAPFVAVVSESFARDHFPGASAIGRRFKMAFAERLVVGVVRDIRVRGLERPSEPQVYLPSGQVPDGGLILYAPKDLIVRAETSLEPLVPAIRAIVARADPEQPISDVSRRNVALQINPGLASPR